MLQTKDRLSPSERHKKTKKHQTYERGKFDYIAYHSIITVFTVRLSIYPPPFSPAPVVDNPLEPHHRPLLCQIYSMHPDQPNIRESLWHSGSTVPPFPQINGGRETPFFT